MEILVRKVGNSHVMTIPNDIVLLWELKDGDIVNLEIENKDCVVFKIRRNK